MSDVVVPFSGWGRGAWGQLAFGEGSITNDGAAGQVGSVTVAAEANVPVDGLEATASVGSVTIVAEANVFPTGLEASGEVGIIASVTGTANVFPTGVEGTGEVGIPTINADANVPTEGLEAVASVAAVTVVANADVDVTGVAATGVVNAVENVTGDANVSPTAPNAGTGQAGQVIARAAAVVEIEMDARGNGLVGEVEAQAGADVLPEGLEATGEVGNGTVITIDTRIIIEAPDAAQGQAGQVTQIGDAIVNVTGVEGTGEAGQVLVWGRIVPNQNPSYNPVTPSSTPAWSDDTPSQTPGWDDIAA